MADAAGAVNAAATSTTPVAPQQGRPAAPAVPPQQAKKAPAAPDFKSKVEETLWRVNEPTSDEVEDTKSMSDIIDKGIADAGKPSKDATPERERQQQEPPPPKEPTGEKKKYKVDGKVYELTDEQAERFAQKGIMHELRNREAANRDRAIAAKEQEISRREQEAQQVIEALKSKSLDALVELHGEEKTREMLEQWLRPRIEREMLPPEEQEKITWQERAERAEQRLQQQQQQEQERQIEEQSRGLEQHYQKIIVQALEEGNFPKGADLTPFAKEMAGWMERGLVNNIEYTPAQLVKLVKEDNATRVNTLTGTYVGQIETARKAGDMATVSKLGEQLVEVLGEPVMYAIGKYHLAKLSSRGLPETSVPLSAPKTEAQKAMKPPRMTEDQVREMRQQIARGEIEPPPWW
jgi:hypothetical protein